MTDASKTWTYGCDACDDDVLVMYVNPIGYLCASCRKPETIEAIRRMLYGGT